MRKRVIAVSPGAEAGGAEHLVCDLLAQLKARGWSILVAIHGHGPLEEMVRASDLKPVILPPFRARSPQSMLSAASSLRRLITEFQPDIVYSNHPKGQLIARMTGSVSP